MIQIIPSILAKTQAEFEQMVHKLEPHVERVHLDIIDGKFAPTATIEGFKELAAINTKLSFDVHLMVKEPNLESWYESKADRFILHAESDGDMLDNLMKLEKSGKRRALAINPETDTEKIISLMPHLDFIQFMTVKPGFYGSPFIPEVLEKIKLFHGMHPQVAIAVDGAINPDTAAQVCAAGASLLVSGSYIMESSDIPSALNKLSEACS